MRVLIATGIYPPDVGGPASYSALLEKEFPKRGVQVKVLSFGWFLAYPKVLRHFLYFLKVIKLGRDCDIIYAQDPVSVGLPAILASKFLGKKFTTPVRGERGPRGLPDLFLTFLKPPSGFLGGGFLIIAQKLFYKICNQMFSLGLIVQPMNSGIFFKPGQLTFGKLAAGQG